MSSLTAQLKSEPTEDRLKKLERLERVESLFARRDRQLVKRGKLAFVETCCGGEEYNNQVLNTRARVNVSDWIYNLLREERGRLFKILGYKTIAELYNQD